MVYLLWIFQKRKIEAEPRVSKEGNGKGPVQAAEILANQVPEAEAKGMGILLNSGDLNICYSIYCSGNSVCQIHLCEDTGRLVTTSRAVHEALLIFVHELFGIFIIISM